MEANDLWEPVPPAAGGRNNNRGDNDNNINDNNNGGQLAAVLEEAVLNIDGSYEGGVASGVDGPNASSSSCDIVLFMECMEKIDINPNHPMLQPGVTVSIGLDKNTKLSAVFNRYCDFLNEHSNVLSAGGMAVVPTDLEFVFCTLLYPNDTAEASALMKNDKIKVRRVRTAEREAQNEQRRYQRESDRDYFKQLRCLVPDLIGNKTGDVVLDCQGKLVDENGLNQEVLRTTVRGHSAILAKRCKWLGRAIQCAKDEMERRSVITIPENEQPSRQDEDEEPEIPPPQQPQDSSQQPQRHHDNRVVSNEDQPPPAFPEDDDDDDDGIEVLPYPINHDGVQNAARRDGDSRSGSGVAAEIENDEDEDDDIIMQDSNLKRRIKPDDHGKRAPSPVLSSAASDANSNLLWVTLPNHPPEAVKLLLEYCCTNRVIPLGRDAFIESCRTKPEASHNKHHHQQHTGNPNHSGPVSPFHHGHHSQTSKRWPNSGSPTVSFSVALSGISLAEEASMSRFSLMCEIAAAQLVTHSNFVEALSACSVQQSRTGNSLPRLRQAAMDILLRSGKRGVDTLCSRPTFQRALEERSFAVVPSLLNGTMELVTAETSKSSNSHHHGHHHNHSNSASKSTKRELSAETQSYFEKFDKDDAYRRETERRKRRVERWKERGEIPPDIDDYSFSPNNHLSGALMDTFMMETAHTIHRQKIFTNAMKRISSHYSVGPSSGVGAGSNSSSHFAAALAGASAGGSTGTYLSTTSTGGAHLFRPLPRARSRSGDSGTGGTHHHHHSSHRNHHNSNSSSNRTGRRSGRRN